MDKLEGLERQGKRVKALEGRPTLWPHLMPIWSAYLGLSAGRSWSVGMAAIPNPIPFEAIDRWAARFGPHEEGEFEEFLSMIRTLDAIHLEHSMPKPKPKKAGQPEPELQP